MRNLALQPRVCAVLFIRAMVTENCHELNSVKEDAGVEVEGNT